MPPQNIISTAVKAALTSTHAFRMGAVLFKGGVILRAACNDPRLVSWMSRYHKHPTLHAEVAVVNNVPADILSSCKILVVRISNGRLVMAKPCSSCQRMMYDRKIRRIYYSDENGDIVLL